MMKTQLKNVRLAALMVVLMTLAASPRAQAQSLKDLFNKENIEKAVSAATGKNTASMEGGWTYTGSAMQFEGENVLQNAGGALAASALTDKLDELLAKAGIRPGELGYTFNADGSFVARVGERELKGTYSYDAGTGKANLKFAKLVGLNATVSCTSAQLKLLFDVSRLLDLVSYLSSKSSNATLQSISALAENYEGMLLGLAFARDGGQ